MSRTIDERVVEMRFDNKQFESGAKQTMSTLSRLKEALRLPDVTKGFDNLQKAANRVDMNGIGTAVESVKLKFSALEVAAISALSNIVNRGIDAGVQLAKSLSIDQIFAGFSEYELKMNSVQTIIASTGESLSTVNKYLEELNAYADKTIYSFSDMTSNIGKFTNAGVKLDDAVKAIQGISNEAAVSGANANEASRAMYNFAQAISAGYVKLIDWKSIELANMATVEFKEGLLDTAVALGTVVKVGDKYQSTTTDLKGQVSDLFDATTMFNDSLSAQWLSTDVLVQTLNNYSHDVREMSATEKKAYEEKLRGIGYTEEQIKKIEDLGVKAFNSAQDVKTLSQLIDTMKESVGSGWAQTFELIFGDFEEAKNLWTNVNNTLGAALQESSDSRNELLRQWKESGGRTALFDGVANSFKALVSILKAVKTAFRDVFPKTTADQLVSITKGFRDLTAKLIISEGTFGKLRRTFSGLFSIINILGQAVGAFFRLIVPGVSTVKDLSGGFLGVTASIGDWITALDKAIKKNGWFINAVDKVHGVIGNVSNSINKFTNNTFEKFKILFGIEDMSFDDMLNNITKAFQSLSGEIENFSFQRVEDASESLKKKIKSLIDLLMSNEGISVFVTNFKTFGEDLKEAFTLDNLLDRMERVMDVFGKFFNWIKTTMAPAFKDFNFGSAVAAGGGIGIVYSIIKAANAFDKVAGSIKALPDILDGVKDTLGAYQKELKADAILKIAGAITLLSGALVLLSFADTDRLISASIALTLVAGTLMVGISMLLEAMNKGKELNSALTIFSKGLSSSMKKLSRAVEIKAIGSTIKDFAKSIAIIAVSIVGLAVIWRKDPEAFNAALKTIAGISAVLVGLGVLMTVGSRLGRAKGLISIGSSILMFSASLGLIVLSVNKLMKMQLPSDYGVKLAILGGIMTGLGVLAVVLSGAAKLAGGKQLPKMASTIGSLALLLVSTVLSLKILFKMQLPSDYGVKLAILGGIFVAFGVLLVAMGAAARLSGGNGFKAAATILSMAAFLVVIVGSLMILTIIPGDKMLKGAVALGGVLLALGAALYGAGQISDKNAYKSVIAMALAVGVITAALAVLSMIPFTKLLVSAVALGAVLLAIGNNFKNVSKVQSKKAIPAIIAMIAATMTIAYSLYALSEQPWENLLSAATAMSATLLAFSKSFEMILGKRWSENNVKKIGTFLLLTLAVIPIGVALGVLANQPWDGLLAAGVSISGTLLALSLCFSIIGKTKVNLTAIASVVAGSASLILVAAGIAILAKYNPQDLLASCLSLSAMLVVLVGVMTACSVLSSAIGPAMVGVLGLGAVIAELALVLAAIGGLAQIPGLKWLVDEGGVLLQGVGTAIGKMVGGLVGGAMVGVSDQLPQIGANLSDFIGKLGPFLEGAKAIKEGDTLSGVKSLASIIISLTIADVINGITKLLGFSLVPVAVELSEFMTKLQPFISQSKDLKEDSMKACSYLADMIIKLTAVDLISGIGRFLGLSGSLEQFGEELASFGPSIKSFADIVKDIKPEAVQGAAAAAEIMADLATKLPASDGLAQKIFGDKSLAEFGQELVSFGPAIRSFSMIVKDVKPEAVQGASAAAEIMANLAIKLPDQGGLAAKIFGDNTLSSFGEELTKFGPKIVQFATQVQNVRPAAVTGAASATAIMSTLANNLPSNETLWNKIFGGGQVSLSSFGEELIKFGTSMSEFSSSVSGINVENINQTITTFKDLVDLGNYVQDGSANSLVNFTNQLGNIGVDSINKFVQAFTDSSSKVSGAVSTLMTTVQTTIQGKYETFNTIGILCVNSLLSGISSKYPEASLVGTTLGNGILMALQALEPTFLVRGSSAAAQYLLGFKNKFGEASSVGRTLANNALSGCQGAVSGFYNAGSAAGQGFVDGLSSKINAASEAGSAIGNAAYKAAKKALEEKSPSKKMREVGDFAGLGFVKGLLVYVAKASEAGEKIGNAAVKKAISVVSVINDDFNIDPTIRPVVDLGEVKKSVSDINRMFNESVSYTAALARSASASTKMLSKDYGIQNEDIDPNSSETGKSYTFVQNNYSPKALSRIDIYRQTKNQFSRFKEATDNL